jgi:hypothetical protein
MMSRPFALATTLTLLLLATTPAAAQTSSGLHPPDHPSVRIIAGAWDLSSPRGRKCRLQLNQRSAESKGLIIGLPPVCRATFQALSAAQTWALARDGQVVFLAADGKELARFARTAGGPLKATLAGDELQLDPAQGRYPNAEQRQAVIAATSPPGAASTPNAAARPATPAVAIAPAANVPPPPATDLPGPYGLLRGDGREVCKVDLKAVPGLRAGLQSASFIGPCADQGLKVFDPAGWRYEAGKLHLVARRGHEIAFVFEGNGQWRKDPPTGAALGLRKGTR